MESIHRNLCLVTSAAALTLGVSGASPVMAEIAPFAFTGVPSATIEPASPLMLSAASIEQAAPEPAKGESPFDDGWHFRLSIPIWIPGVSGDISVRGHELTGGTSSSDFFNSVGTTLDFAGVLHFEAEKGHWGFLVDTMYVAFSDERDVRTGGTADAKVKMFLGELDGYYILTAPKRGEKGWGAFRADVLAGVRAASLELEADANRFDAKRSRDLVDPIIGARMEVGLLDWLSYKLRGDIGGFNINDAVNWNIDTALEFHLAKWFDIDLGYRWLDYDIHGLGRHDGTKADLLIGGPYLTLQFRF